MFPLIFLVIICFSYCLDNFYGFRLILTTTCDTFAAWNNWLHTLSIIHKSVILLFETITLCAGQIILPRFLFSSLMENTVSKLNIITTSCEDAHRVSVSYNHFFGSFWFFIILEVPNPICYAFLFSKSLSLWTWPLVPCHLSVVFVS